MLPSLSRTVSRIAGRTVLFVAVLGIAGLALPTLKWTTHSPLSAPAMAETGAEGSAEAEKNASGSKPREEPAVGSKTREPASGVEFLPRPTRTEEKIVETLEKPTTCDFQELPLEEALTYLKDYHNINVWLDRNTFADEGVALEQPVTLKLAGVRLESVLHLLLDRLQLVFVVEDDVMKITTRGKAKETLITRTYPVRDLYQGRNKLEVQISRTSSKDSSGTSSSSTSSTAKSSADGNSAQKQETADKKAGADNKNATKKGGGPPSRTSGPVKYADLEQAITDTIEPDSWEELSGPGSYTYVKETGCLVIRQTWSVHRQILQLLRDLREAKRPGQN